MSCHCLHPTRAVVSLRIGIINPNLHALIGSSTAAPCVIGSPQDHSGVLHAEEFKACLISLGYDVENDKQVWARPVKKGLRWLPSVCVYVCACRITHSFHHSLTPSLTCCAAAWKGALCRSAKVLLSCFMFLTASFFFLFSLLVLAVTSLLLLLVFCTNSFWFLSSNSNSSVCVQPLHLPKFSAFHMHPSCFFSHPSLCEL